MEYMYLNLETVYFTFDSETFGTTKIKFLRDILSFMITMFAWSRKKNTQKRDFSKLHYFLFINKSFCFIPHCLTYLEIVNCPLAHTCFI